MHYKVCRNLILVCFTQLCLKDMAFNLTVTLQVIIRSPFLVATLWRGNPPPMQSIGTRWLNDYSNNIPMLKTLEKPKQATTLQDASPNFCFLKWMD